MKKTLWFFAGKKTGFSLLEVILGVVLLTLLSTGIMEVWTWAQRGTKHQEEGQAVELYLDKKMAELKSEFETTRIVPTTTGSVPTDFTGRLDSPILEIDATNTEVKEGQNVGLERVKLTFRWKVPSVKGQTPVDKKRELVGYFFKE